jgi:hypothetical protein
VLDTSLSAQAKEGSPSCINLTVMSRDKESTTVLTVLGRTPNTRDVQQKPEDSAKPVHEEGKDDGSTEVDYEGETSDEDRLPTSRNPLSCTRPALTVEPSTTLIQEPALNHEEEIMKESPNAAESAKQVLDGKRILEIAERKEISIKTPVHNHNPQRQGLEDNLFDFGDALVDYTSDGGTIRINQGLATFMLIAASAEAPNRLLMERKREAFDQVTAQAQELLEKQRNDYERQREAIAKQHQEHLETMRKQNELLQEEVMKTRELYSRTYQEFEVTPPSTSGEVMMQATLATNYKNKAERLKADYEMEKSKRQQKEKDLQDAEERISKLKKEIAHLEDSFEVVAKRPLMKSENDSPELHAEKKVKVEEVPDNGQAIKSLKGIKNVDEFKSHKAGIMNVYEFKSQEGIMNKERVKSPKDFKSEESIKKDAKIKKRDEEQSSGSKPEDVLELDSEGDIVSRTDKPATTAKPGPGHKDYFSIEMRSENIKGGVGYIKRPPLKTLLGADGLNASDQDLIKQSLIAWRTHLKSRGDYKPDMCLPRETHLKHAKILMAALSNFKYERVRNGLTYKAVLFYKHDRYSDLYKSYHVPEETCSPYELMSKVDQDRGILYRLRCAPLNAFYSMLMEDTPGYIPSEHWTKPPIYEPSRVKSIRDGRSTSSSRSSRSSESISKSPNMIQDSRDSRESFTVKIQDSRDSRESSSVMIESSSKSRSVKEDVMWGSTEHLSARRYKNMQRGQRFNPIVGEEKGYSSESGNDREDKDNSHYDSRLLPADKKTLAACQWKIKKIKQQDFPKEYLDTREKWLKEAEAARIKIGMIPTCLHDVQPPWDTGKGLAQVRYNEMIISGMNRTIKNLRERNAASCAKYDAEKLHGPKDGQDRR